MNFAFFLFGRMSEQILTKNDIVTLNKIWQTPIKVEVDQVQE
jgi:hypothetical protein